MNKREMNKKEMNKREMNKREMNKREMSGSDVGVVTSPGVAVTPPTVTSLTGVEVEVMDVVWDLDRPVLNIEVSEAVLYSRRGRGLEPIPFQTVNTALRRLSGKGVLRLVGKPGDTCALSRREARTPYYEAALGREEMAAHILDNVARTLLGSPMAALLPRLTGRAGPGASRVDDQERLRRLAEAIEAAGAAESGRVKIAAWR